MPRTTRWTRVAIPLLLGALGGLPGPAHAAIDPAEVIDGPSAEILELGGVAMAEDGTGGVVYRRQSEGRSRVFVARFAGGRWQRPRRVDAGQQFDSRFPRIAAGNGGRLLAVWTQELGEDTDRLSSATLDPGATRFERPISVDFNVREATATDPSLAMAPGGQALVAYRVVTREGGSGDTSIPRGTVLGEIRVARFNGQTWSRLGAVNRSLSAPLRAAAPGNGPQVGIDTTGAGVVAWQESDDDRVDRIFARRIFSSGPGFPLLVSPREIDGRGVRGPADQLDLAVAGFGRAALAYRVQPGPDGFPERPRILLSTLPEAFEENSADFRAPRFADGAGPGAGSADPAVSLTPRGEVALAFGRGAGAGLLGVSSDGKETARTLGDAAGTTPATPLVALGEAGATVTAWRRQGEARTGVGIEEAPAGREARTALVAVGDGPLGELRLGGSGSGDALVGFRQGDGSRSRIAVATVDGPPVRPALDVPQDHVRPARAIVRWAPPAPGLGEVRHTVLLDGVARARDLAASRFRLPRAGLEDGTYEVVVLATDARGQGTASRPAALKVDGTRPRVRLAFDPRTRIARVRVDDGPARRSAGIDEEQVVVDFGDGGDPDEGVASASRRLRRGRRATVKVTAVDLAGNRTRLTRRIVVP